MPLAFVTVQLTLDLSDSCVKSAHIHLWSNNQRLMDTARREVVSRAAHLADNGPVLVKRCNKANGRFTPRPKGAPQVTWHLVAALEKDMPFPAGCALFQVTWDALYPSILGCSATNTARFFLVLEQIRGNLNSYRQFKR